MNPIERTSVSFPPVDLMTLPSKIELEEEVPEGEDGELHDIFAQSDGVAPHHRRPPAKPGLPSLLRAVRRRSPEVDEAPPESRLDLEQKEPESDESEDQMGYLALRIPVPSPCALELFVLGREASSSPYTRRPQTSPPEFSPDVERQKRGRYEQIEEVDISNPSEVIKKIWATPSFYKKIDPSIPVKREPKVLKCVLQTEPESFFDLPSDLQTDSVLQKIGFLSARMKRREDLCQRLVVFSTIRGSQGLVEFDHLISDSINWESRNLLRDFFREHPESREDRELLLAFLCLGADVFAHIGPLIRCDKSFFMLASEMGCPVLQYVDPILEKDKELVFALLRRQPQELVDAHTCFQEDRSFLIDVARQNGTILGYVQMPLRNDREIVAAAVRQNGMMLCYASASIRNDPIIVQLAIRQNPEALRFASVFVRDDLETVLKAVEKKPDTLRFASLRVQRQIQLRRQALVPASPPPLMGRKNQGSPGDVE